MEQDTILNKTKQEHYTGQIMPKPKLERVFSMTRSG